MKKKVIKKVVKKVKKIWSKKTMKWFTEKIDKWIKKYHLGDWVVLITFSDDKAKEDEDGKLTLATCQPDEVYHKATIVLYPEILKNRKEKYSETYVENCIKHEVAHMLTIKISALALDRHSTEKDIIDEIESLTQKISIIT